MGRIDFAGSVLALAHGDLGVDLKVSRWSLVKLLLQANDWCDADAVSRGGSFWLTLSAASAMWGVTRRTAIAHLRELLGAGYLEDVGRGANRARLVRFVGSRLVLVEEGS